MTSFLRDFKFALRQLRAHPGFSVTAVLVLAIGLGSSAAIFSVVDAVLLRPLPYPHPETLVGVFESNVIDTGSDDTYNSVSPGLFLDWQANARSLATLSAVQTTSFNISSKSQSFNPEHIDGIACSPEFAHILGVRPALGRFFNKSEDQYNGPYVAVLSYRFWQSHFGGSRGVLTQQVRLDGNDYAILGVLPKSFVYPGRRSDVFIPFKRNLDKSNWHSFDNHFFQLIGRLAPGYSRAAAQAELSSILRDARRNHPNDLIGKSATVIGLNEYLVRGIRTGLLVLLGAVGCLLLIACVNIANLLLTRSAGRRRELTVRLAVGASRFQVVRQLLVESTTVSILGAAAGLLVSNWASSFLARNAPGAGDLPQAAHIHTSVAVIAFTVALALVSGVAAGMFPALAASRTDLVSGLRDSSRSTTSSRSLGYLRDTLVGVEVSLSLVLLVAAGLLFHSFVNLLNVRPGFRAGNSVSFAISLPDASYKNPQSVSQFVRQFARELRSMPGVVLAGLVSYPPLAGHWSDSVFHIKGHPLPEGSMMDLVNREADPEYFHAMQIPLLRGRFFTPQDGIGFDEKHPKLGAMIISEATAKKFFHSLNPVGQTLELGTDRGLPPDPSGNPYPEYQIVGVVGDVPSSAETGIEPTVYRPLFDGEDSNFYGVLHTTGDPLALGRAIQEAVHRLDPDIPIHNLQTFAQINRDATKDNRFSATLLLLFAASALVLAAIGLYGVVSYAVTQRTSEIGIRMALGATRSRVGRGVLLDGMKPAALGLVAGIVVSLAISQLFKSLLFGVSTSDSITFAAVLTLLVITASLACLIPALRATRIDPAIALRTL